MCKVLMVAGIKPENLNKVHKLLKAAAKNMSNIEEDGVGYAAITKTGAIYGEKWLNKEDAFNIHTQPVIEVNPIEAKLRSFLGVMGDFAPLKNQGKIYDAFGHRHNRAVNDTVAVILHARKATTGDKTVENVHPFAMVNVEEHPDTAIIHNGSIVNHLRLKKTMSTCDSEVILHQYVENVVYNNPYGIHEVAKALRGEYAVGALSSMIGPDGAATPILDVFKSGKDLIAGYVPELETTVFCTMEHTLENSCKDAGLTLKNVVKIKEGYLLRVDAVTGERIDEIISFTTSSKFDTSAYEDRFKPQAMAPHSALPKNLRTVGPHLNTPAIDDITPTEDDNTIETAKKNFKRRHPSIFTMPYVQVDKPLADDEKALFSELSASNTTNHKALHLVAVALASVGAKG